MKKTTTKKALIPSLYCSVFGHNFQVTKQVTHHVKEYTCKHCKKELTTNGNGSLIELTPKFREINSILENIHQRRMIRLNQKAYSNRELQISA